jgi:hypothetical protein
MAPAWVIAAVIVGVIEELEPVRRIAEPGLGQAEVEDLHVAVGSQHDVGRLQVAVDDPVLVRRLQPVGDLAGDPHDLVRRHRPLLHAPAQVLPLHQLHHQEADPAFLLETVDRGDVGMLQAGQGPRLALEPGLALGIARELGRQDLDRHVAAELRVAGAEHLAHAALADLALDLVMQECLPDHAGPLGSGNAENVSG